MSIDCGQDWLRVQLPFISDELRVFLVENFLSAHLRSSNLLYVHFVSAFTLFLV